MAQKKSGSGKAASGSGGPGRDKRRPTATIELSAKEIETRDIDPPAGVGPGKSAKAGASTPKGAQPSATGAASASAGTKAEKAEKVETGAKAGKAEKPDRAEKDKAASAAKPQIKGATAKPAGAKKAAGATPAGAAIGAAAKARTVAREARAGLAPGTLFVALVAGIVGALIGLVGASAILGFGEGREQARVLETRIAALESALEKRRTGGEALKSLEALGARLDRLAGRLEKAEAAGTALARLEAGQKALADRAAALERKLAERAKAQPDPELSARMAKLEKTLATLSAMAEKGRGGRIAQVAKLAGRINDFEAALDAKITALEKTLTKRYADDLAALEARIGPSGVTREAVETLKAARKRLGIEIETVRADVARIDETLAGLKSGLESLAAAGARNAQAARKLDKRVADLARSLRGELAALAGKADAGESAIAALSFELRQIGKRLDAVLARETARRESVRHILLSLELTNLKRALERGEPYASQLAEVRKLAPEGLDLGALEPYKHEGVPRITVLQRDFARIARAVIDAEARAREGGGILDRLLTNARSIVRVRRTGYVAGGSAEAIVARMEAHLKAGDLAAALDEAKGLTGEARKVADPWLAQVAARRSVDLALRAVEDRLKRTIGVSAAPAAGIAAAPAGGR